MRFDLGGDARVVRGADGRLSAFAGTAVLATAEPAVMWDSNTVLSASARAAAVGKNQGGGLPGRSSAAAPGDVARTAAVGVEVAGRALLLRPDAALLSEAAAYPVFIDPAWSTGKSRWAYATNNNTNNTDTAVARVGRDPDSGKIYRSYFDFPLSSMKGKHIESAYVQMKLDHSWSCDNTPTYMYHSASISTTPRTSWAPKLNSLKASAQSHANEGSGCSDSPQPDMTVNFTGSAVTSIIQTHATNNWTNITLGFCACSATDGTGESTTDRYKKFWPANAKLIVDYDSIPGAPIVLQAAGLSCPTGQQITIGTLTPTFSAIFPDSDSTQALTTAYEWVQVPSSGVIDSTTPRRTPPTGASVPANGRSTTATLSGLTALTRYAFRAKATDPAPYSRTSAWSGWCQFMVDTFVPRVGVVAVGADSGPGSVKMIRINTRDETVKSFRYGWTSPPTTGIGAGTVWYEPGKSATLRLVVPKYGLNVLYFSAVDGAGNIGYGSYEFIAKRPSPAVARWSLETYPGATRAQALADSQPSLAGDTPLSGGTTTWDSDAHLVRGQAATFQGGSASALTATGPVVDTSDDFSVAAWVRLRSTTCGGNQTVLSADGAHNSAFYLTYDCTAKKWRMRIPDADKIGVVLENAVAPTTAVADRWVHLAGSWDATNNKITLWVDGVPTTVTASGTFMANRGLGWAATGPLVVGRDRLADANGGFFSGWVTDVQVYDRLLVAHDFTGQLASDPTSGGVDEPGMLAAVKVGEWSFAGATPCYEESTDPWLCGAPEAGQFGRRLALTQGSNVGYGHRDDGLLLDATHFVDDPADPYYGLATREYGRSQNNLADPQAPVWQDGRVLRTNESFSVSAWVNPNAFGTQTAVSQIGTKQSAFYLGQRGFNVNGTTEYRWSFTMWGVDSDDSQGKTITARMTSRIMDEGDLSTWTHLVGVYDLSRREIRLYVNGDLVNTVSFATGLFTGAFDATGPLVVGGARFTPTGQATQWADRWNGGIDDLGLYQGALTDAGVQTLFDAEKVQDVIPIE
ncbi:LamG domain-containing protein [Micromonospora sp. CV4]|uniref:LamG domain-containing protein n=1 Tax=Micromonospora sp. CV4 TaxID=2478711 RepID=UPI001315736C|nr:LamG domain-containing protein [Micromonospora sp. CV4]